MAHVIPRYDALGFDSGLWSLYDEQYDGVCECMYDYLVLFRRNGKLTVGQYPDWDAETYDEYGCVDAEYVSLGEIDCPNPYMVEDAANTLYNWLLTNDKATSE